ncbi:glycosyltransferase [Gloeocapsopsis crepidinum LEGE 06123]|uniref:Glycosyltransferase n=1 Tax=Gloeocapsopsis crepidinum LEGE 06123 TaxID=588587 RepID=A0ABR9UM10_9CHRO|nr:glycosyltransferase family 4 protein [Gloeocapsopsis crepidinum]MBE9189326.1 glycosyltransferase [Gloeocapsopsis crepidinum LEGE 06123]
MTKLANDTLSLWQEEGSQLIQQNLEVFRNLVTQAKDFVDRDKYDMAAVYGEMAATYASGKHCGLFVSWELERILLSIGKKALRSNTYSSENCSSHAMPKKVLHVATSMKSIGGHSRMLWRWIQQDTERSHSLVLTRQAPTVVPNLLKEAVSNSGGRIYQLNTRIGSIISWAKQLRKIAINADLVVLHTHSSDVIPIIAFSDKERLPPVILIDHADHLFWLGASVSDIVVGLRESGMRLAQERRHIEPKRNVLLPIILEPTQRVLSRAEAKQQLGIPKESILLLSIARAVKYKTIDGISFADAHVPLLQQHQQAILVVIGPGEREDWSEAIQLTQGRIKVLSETEYTRVFYQAADIYVDSFPFVSNTSLLEAGSYGVPLISRYPYSSDACGVLGADMPGLTGNLVCVRNLEEYTATLSQLVENTEFRLGLGEATRNKIVETHCGDGWQRSLNNVYSCIATLAKVSSIANLEDKIALSELDVFLPKVHDIDIDDDKLIQWHMSLMPTIERLFYWFNLLKKNSLRQNPLNLLAPEWLRSRYYLLRSHYS